MLLLQTAEKGDVRNAARPIGQRFEDGECDKVGQNGGVPWELFVRVPRLKPVTLASKGKQGCVICRKVCSEPRFPKIQVVKSNVPFFEVFVSYK